MLAIIMVNCSDDDPPAPVVDFFADVNGTEVTFNSEVSDATSLLWDFGDGNTSTEADPIHIYAMSGDYTVTLTAEGHGGETTATKKVSIAASKQELLTGGPIAANGKTWVLSTTATAGLDGVGTVANDFPSNIFPATDNLLALIGLEAEYDNEYTFVYDGSYSINTKNDLALATWYYAHAALGVDKIVTMTADGVFQVQQTNISGATWTLNEGNNLTIAAATADDDGKILDEYDVTFDNADVIEFGNGGFIGIMDFTTKAIVREISSDRMVLSIFVHGGYSTERPTMIFTLSFDAK